MTVWIVTCKGMFIEAVATQAEGKALIEYTAIKHPYTDQTEYRVVECEVETDVYSRAIRFLTEGV